MRKATGGRLRIWKEVVWRPWLWVLSSAYAVLGFYQTVEWLTGWRLPNILPAFPWWLWALVGLVLFIMVILEGAYRSVADRDNTISARDRVIADLIAAAPKLRVVFDRECKSCFDYGQSALVNLGVWNAGAAAEDVQVYLASTTPGPRLGKLGLLWSGENSDGRRINATAQSGHYHFTLLYADQHGPYSLVAGIPDEHRHFSSQPYTAEIVVEGSNVRLPVRVRVEVDPRKKGEPPILAVSPVTS